MSSSSIVFRPESPNSPLTSMGFEEEGATNVTPTNGAYFHNRASEKVLGKLGQVNGVVRDIFYSSALDRCRTTDKKPSLINRTASIMAKTDSAITGITSGALFLGPLPAAIIGIALLPIRFVAATLAMIVGIVASVTVATKACLDRNPTVKKVVLIFIAAIVVAAAIAVLTAAVLKGWIPLLAAALIGVGILIVTNTFTFVGMLMLKSQCSKLDNQVKALLAGGEEAEALRLQEQGKKLEEEVKAEIKKGVVEISTT